MLKIDYPGKSGISVVKVVCNLFSSLLIVTAPVCDFFMVCWVAQRCVTAKFFES